MLSIYSKMNWVTHKHTLWSELFKCGGCTNLICGKILTGLAGVAGNYEDADGVILLRWLQPSLTCPPRLRVAFYTCYAGTQVLRPGQAIFQHGRCEVVCGLTLDCGYARMVSETQTITLGKLWIDPSSLQTTTRHRDDGYGQKVKTMTKVTRQAASNPSTISNWEVCTYRSTLISNKKPCTHVEQEWVKYKMQGVRLNWHG